MVKTGPFDIGDEIILSADFEDDTGAPADPIAVTLKLLDPAGALTTVGTEDLDNPSAGRWEHRLVIDQAGRWHYRYAGVGDVTVAEERVFHVRTSAFV